jgi:hypothetical protein
MPKKNGAFAGGPFFLPKIENSKNHSSKKYFLKEITNEN